MEVPKIKCVEEISKQFPPSLQKTRILEMHIRSALKRRKVSLWMCLQEDRRQKTLSL